jgi:hypothetical protein
LLLTGKGQVFPASILFHSVSRTLRSHACDIAIASPGAQCPRPAQGNGITEYRR